MHATYHETFHIVDDHNELRQGEAAMADVWGTRDWADRHFAEGIGLWEVNVYKAAVAFQGVTYHHSEFRKRLALEFLTLGKHEWGKPLVQSTTETPAQPGPSMEHKFVPLSQLTGKQNHAKLCGYCGTESAYMICTMCFPDVTQCTYAICNANTGRACINEHCSGVLPRHTGHKVKLPANAPARAGLREDAATQRKKAQARAAAQIGGLATQAAKKSKARH
jgi:hypothetical protein